MYQMLTGVLPYVTPTPGDLDRLMRKDLAAAPRVRNPRLPKAISDIVMKAMAPEILSRYQSARELLDAILAARTSSEPRRQGRQRAVSAGGAASEEAHDIQARLKARETLQPRFCWKCGKALHARADQCPFCGEAQ